MSGAVSPTPEQVAKYQREKKFPVNNLDSAWMSAVPNYTELQNTFIEVNFSKVFELFNESIRLANIPSSRAKILEYDLVTAGYALQLKYIEVAMSVLFDVATIVEVSHGVKGFRTKAMNMIIQEIKQSTSNNNKKKKGVFGDDKEE